MLFLFAAAVRIGFLLWRGVQIAPDSTAYLTLAHNLITHASFSLDTTSPFSPTIRCPPLYPAFIGALALVGASSVTAIAGAQVFLASATTVILFLMLRTCVDLRWAVLGSVVYVVHPAAAVSVNAILTETLFTFLLVASIYWLSLSFEKRKLSMALGSGFILGLAILCRPIALLLPFVLLVPMMLTVPRRQAVTHFALVAAMVLVIVAPWSIRSTVVSGRFVTVEDSTVGAALFYAASRWDWNQKDEATLWRAIAELYPGLGEFAATEKNDLSGPRERLDRILIRAAVANIRANPAAYLKSRARNFPYLFITSYDSATGFNQTLGSTLAQRDWFRLLVKISLLMLFSVIPMLLGIVGLSLARKNITVALCSAVWLYVLLFYIPLWVEIRYWTPCVPLLLVSAVFGASTLWQRFARRASRI